MLAKLLIEKNLNLQIMSLVVVAMATTVARMKLVEMKREAEAMLTGPVAVKQKEKKPTTVRSGIPRKRCVPLKTKTKI